MSKSKRPRLSAEQREAVRHTLRELSSALDDLCMLELPLPFTLDGVDPLVAFYFGKLEAVRLRIVEQWAPHWEREQRHGNDKGNKD